MNVGRRTHFRPACEGRGCAQRWGGGLLIALLAACQGPPPPPLPPNGMALDRQAARRDPASVPKSGDFPTLEAARAAASRPDVAGPAVRGQVLAAEGDGTRAVADALVSTSDGRAGLSGPDGRFAIAGAWPKDGGLVASHPAYVASAVAGLPADAEPALHLRARSVVAEGPAPAVTRPFRVTGRMVDGGGAPVAGVLVVLEDARGAFSAPASSGADGRFELTVFAAGQRVEAGTLVAAGDVGGETWLGLRTAVAASAEVADLGDMPVAPADRTLEVAVDGTAMPGVPVRRQLALVAADGASLGLPGVDGRYRLAPVAGGRFELLAEAADVAAGTASMVRRTVEPGPGETREAAVLLAPPGTELAPALVLNEALGWAPVAGAVGYHASLAAIGGPGFLWEGYSAAPALPLSFQDVLAPGLYGLTIAALDAPGLSTRAVANVGPAGPRALRLPADGGPLRRSSRQFRVEI